MYIVCTVYILYAALCAILYFAGGVTNSMTDDETDSARKDGVSYLYFILAGADNIQ
jgi:hypothetical protein